MIRPTQGLFFAGMDLALLLVRHRVDRGLLLRTAAAIHDGPPI